MKITIILTIGIMLLGIPTGTLAREIVAIDWSGSADIPDRGEHFESAVVVDASVDELITGILCEVTIDDQGNSDFWCSDYEISLSSYEHGGTANYHLLWDKIGGRTDKDLDDDLADDDDIELSRWTNTFNGGNPNQRWYVSIQDKVSFHPVLPPEAGLGCVKRIRLVIHTGPIIFVSAAATGANDGTSWTDAFVHLQDALASAIAGTEIRIGQGTYWPDLGVGQNPNDRMATFRLINGVILMGGFAGSGTSDPDARDINSYETILSGNIGDPATNADNSIHVVMAVGCDDSTVLDGLTIADGNADLETTPENRGAGLFNNPASLKVIDCTFRDNAAAWFGAGMYNNANSKSEPNVIRCTFLNNTVGSNGGAVYSHSTCNPTFTYCLFENNTAVSGGGGAIQVLMGNAILNHCDFVDNSAKVGGALYVNESSLEAIDCTFVGSSAVDDGGATKFDSNSVPTFVGCTFTENTAKRGGAISVLRNSISTAKDCTFQDNMAGTYGGVIYINGSEQTLVDCIFERNIALSGTGGAVQTSVGNVSIANCEFLENSATGGGALYTYVSGADVTNSAFIGNSAVEDGGSIKFDSNSVSNLTSCSFMENTSKRGAAISIWRNNIGNAKDCTFLGNAASVLGGAMYINSCEQILTNCTMMGNTSGASSGAMNVYRSVLTMINCRLFGNQSEVNGGAIGNSESDSLFFGCVFSGNWAKEYGGGLFNGNCAKLVQVLNCTFSSNQAGNQGGGIHDSNSPLILTNSILWGNTATDGAQLALATNCTAAISYSDVQDDQFAIFVATGCTNEWSIGNLAADPCFTDADGLDNVPGTEDDQLDLLAVSPCIDAGDNMQVLADVVDLDDDGDTNERMPLDIAGHIRFMDIPTSINTGIADPPMYPAIVDMGAYESEI